MIKVLFGLLISINIVSGAISDDDVTFISNSDIFVSGTKFVGQYVGEGAGDITWTSPETCTQSTISRTTEVFLCYLGGDVQIDLDVGADSTSLTVELERSSFCYKWDMDTESDKLNVWVSDSNDNKLSDISYEFSTLGESPALKLHCDKTIITLDRGVFSEASNVWEFVLTASAQYCTWLEVHSIPVGLNGCLIQHTTLPLHTFSIPEQSESTKARSAQSKVCKDYCGSGVTILLDSSNVIISHNNLKTNQFLYYDEDVLDCGVLPNGVILLLVNDGRKLAVFDQFTLNKTVDLSFSADQITVNTKCLSTLESNYKASSAILWRSNKFSVINENELTLTVTDLPDSMNKIHSVSISYLGVIMIMSDSTDSFWYNLDSTTGTFSNGLKLDQDCIGDDCNLYGICPHVTLLVNGNDLYLGTTSGKSILSVRSYITGDVLSLSIQDVAIGNNDEYVILTSDKMVYYGFCSRSGVLKVAENIDSAEMLLFGNVVDLYFIDENGYRTEFPSHVLLKSQLTYETCSLKDFSSSMSSSLIFLDKGETHQYNLSLTTKDYRLPDMLYQFYPSSHALINITSVYSASQSVYGENEVVQSINIEGLEEKGMSVLIASPVTSSPTCSFREADVTYLVVECPKSRGIMIKDKPTSCDQYDDKDMSYVIPPQFNSEMKSKEIEYDLEELGCPIIWPFENKYLPEVWITENNVPTRRVDVDFTIREINNRHDFNFTESISDAKCTVPPQNWKTSGENWGPDNYITCYDTSGYDENDDLPAITQDIKDLQYEVMNTTGLNRLIFAKHKANYTFELIVLDPQTSYCKLSTKFSIWIEDAPNSSDVGIIVLFLACLIMFIILFLSYFKYRNIILTKANLVLQS